jgi:hypothetical protein
VRIFAIDLNVDNIKSKNCEMNRRQITTATLSRQMKRSVVATTSFIVEHNQISLMRSSFCFLFSLRLSIASRLFFQSILVSIEQVDPTSCHIQTKFLIILFFIMFFVATNSDCNRWKLNIDLCLFRRKLKLNSMTNLPMNVI